MPRSKFADHMRIVASYEAGKCWPWPGRIHPEGYGQTFWNGHRMNAHRAMYELLIGPIPTGLDLDHLCRNRSCVNPAHLEPVTRRENIRRGETGSWFRSKTHCPRGHPYSGANLIVRKGGGRKCRTCHSAGLRVHFARLRARLVGAGLTSKGTPRKRVFTARAS